MSYIGTIVLEFELKGDTPSEAFDDLDEILDAVDEAMRGTGMDNDILLGINAGSTVHEYEP